MSKPSVATPSARNSSSATEGIAGVFLLVVAFAALRAASEGRFGGWFASKFLNTGEARPASSSPTAAALPGASGSSDTGGTKQFGDPVPSASLVSPFGAARDGGARTHMGIDLGAPRGTPVVAIGDGTISYASTGFRLCGTGVKINHGGGFESVYCHLDTIAQGIAKGGTVLRGQTIGTVGNTGNAASTGPHLHFEIRRNGQSINPRALVGR